MLRIASISPSLHALVCMVCARASLLHFVVKKGARGFHGGGSLEHCEDHEVLWIFLVCCISSAQRCLLLKTQCRTSVPAVVAVGEHRIPPERRGLERVCDTTELIPAVWAQSFWRYDFGSGS